MLTMLCDTVTLTPSSTMSLVDSWPPLTMNRLVVNVSSIPLVCRTKNTPGTSAAQRVDVAPVQRQVQNPLVLHHRTQRRGGGLDQLRLRRHRHLLAYRA